MQTQTQELATMGKELTAGNYSKEIYIDGSAVDHS